MMEPNENIYKRQYPMAVIFCCVAALFKLF